MERGLARPEGFPNLGSGVSGQARQCLDGVAGGDHAGYPVSLLAVEGDQCTAKAQGDSSVYGIAATSAACWASDSSSGTHTRCGN